MNKLVNLSTLILITCLLQACPLEDDPKPSVEDLWVREDSSYNCAYFLKLKDGNYLFSTVCELESSQIAMEVDQGSYTLANGKISFMPEEGSCAGLYTIDPYTLKYSHDGEYLQLNGTEGLAVFERYEEDPNSSATGNVTFGCFDDNATFHPNPIAPF